MVKDFFKIALALMTIGQSTMALAWNEQSIIVTSANFDRISTVSSHHSVDSARNISTLFISGLPTECKNGIYYYSSTNKDSHSLILSALVSGQKMSVGFDIDQNTTPWGAKNICIMTQVSLLK